MAELSVLHADYTLTQRKFLGTHFF